MALAAINELIYDRIPFLENNATNTALIERQKAVTFAHLQGQTLLSDEDAYNDGSYTGMKRLLVVDLTAYRLLERKIKESVQDGGKRLKKVKADVAETEFDYAKASDGNGFIKQASGILDDLKESISGYCAILKYSLPGFREDKGGFVPICFYGGDE
jgi:hypothetical protein